MTDSILCLNFRDISMKRLTSKKLSTKSSTTWRPFFWVLAVSWGLSTTLSESSSSLSSKNTFRSWNSWTSAFSKYGNPSQELKILKQGSFLFCPTCQRIPYIINCLRPQVLPAIVLSHRLQITHGVLCIYYAVGCAVWFWVSTGTNNGLFLTCIQGTVEGEASVTALECCENSLVEWLQHWDGSVGQIIKLHIQTGKINVLWIPWGIIKDEKELNFRNSSQTNLSWYGLLHHQNTTNWKPFLYHIFLSFTQGPPSFQGRGHTNYKKIVALNGALALMLHFFCQRPHLP